MASKLQYKVYAPDEHYAAYLDPKVELPARVWREVPNDTVTPEDFRPARIVEGDRTEDDWVDQLAWDYGVSVWVERQKIVDRVTANESDGRVAELDLRKVAWARVALLRRGPSLHFELLGDPSVIWKCVVGVKRP